MTQASTAPPRTGRGGGGGNPPRDRARRIADVRQTLRTARHLWLGTADGGLPHLVPLACVWHEGQLLCATKERNRSVRNLRASGRARLAVGTAQDVILIDAEATIADPATAPPGLAVAFDRLPLNPARVPGVVLLHLRPRTISAWRELSEMPDRVVMRDGAWLDGGPHAGA